MASFRPIPIRVLVHTAKLIHKTRADAWGSQGETVTELTMVRIQGKSKLSYTEKGAGLLCEKTLYFDSVGSRPIGVTFLEGDRIQWQGECYTIRAVKPCYTIGGEGIHHWEVGLV